MINLDLSDRIKELASEHKSVSAFARHVGIGTGLARKYLEFTIPGADKLVQIAERCNVRLEWLATGQGPKHLSDAEASNVPRSSIHIDGELLGRIFDRIGKIYKELGIRVSDIDKGRIAAERYQELTALATGPDEWPSLLDLMEIRIRKSLQIAMDAPGQTKREA